MGRSLPRQHQSPCQCVVSALLLYTSLLQVSSHPGCAQPIHWRFARYRETRQRCGRPHQLTSSKGVQMTHCCIWNTRHVSGWFSFFYHTIYTFLQRVFIHFYNSKQGQQPHVQYCRLHQKIAPQKEYRQHHDHQHAQHHLLTKHKKALHMQSHLAKFSTWLAPLFVQHIEWQAV